MSKLPTELPEQIDLFNQEIEQINVTNGTDFPVSGSASLLLSIITRLFDHRDPYMNGHNQRVATLSLGLAFNSQLGFDPKLLKLLWYGAFLHDIGKFAINIDILNKPGKLTPSEYYMIQHHTILGFNILKDLGIHNMVTDVTRSHHENFDGSGYPDRLIGEAIPLSAQIVKTADVYDALTHDRPYRGKLAREQALTIMEEQRTQFNPVLLKTLETLVE